MGAETYHGSCHCGAVRFSARLDLGQPTTRCNCSLCSKARMWFAFAGPEDFAITEGAAALTDYQWVPPGRDRPFLHHLFCRHCGIRICGWGDDPAFGGKFHAVVLAALDDVPADVLAAAPVRYVDGRHDRFDAAPADTRLL